MNSITLFLKYSRPMIQGALFAGWMWASVTSAAPYFGTRDASLQAISSTTRSEIKTSAHLKYASSGQHQKINKNLYQQLKNIFKNVVSLDRTLAKAHYNLIYDQTGHILLASVHYGHRTYQAIRFTNSQGFTGYYTPTGKALFKTIFSKAPVRYTRISDRFTTHRWHPILHIIRPHYGIDYAAPQGTPIRAIGSGQVNFAGKDGGYGNVIVIQHGSRYQSLYAHLSHFASLIKPGQWVSQGQIIGFVGSTGLATGPHLHFGFYDNGKPVNPEKALKKAQASVYIAQQDLPNFFATSNRLFTQLAYNQSRTTTHG
jgi:murein DD-endopeptidase MepM/ murein hydrolase activator NlpD